MNKKIFFLLTFAFILFIPSFVGIQAQSPEMMRPMPGSEQILPSQPFGQTHAYSVTLRGNQEAVVSMKSIFTNYEEATMSALTFQLPKGKIENISAYQVIVEPQCIQYVSEPVTLGIEKGSRTNVAYQEKCIAYNDADYYGGYYGNMQYMRAPVTSDGDAIVITLPQGVNPQKSGSVVLYYRATGYVKKDLFGAFNYSFETLKTDTTIRSLSVGVNTDADLFLEGTDEKVNYDNSSSTAPLLARDRGMKQGALFSSQELDSYYMGIGYGRVTKYTSDLQPFDSFTVDGRYAESKYQLYGKRFIVGGLLILGVLILISVVVYRLIKILFRNKETTSSKASTPSAHAVLMMSGLGIISSIAAALYTLFLYFFITILQRGYSSELSTVIMLFVLLISCVIYIVFIFGPAIFVGWKRGVWWGVGTLIITVLLLCMYVGLFFLYLFLRQQSMYSPGYPTVYPTFDSGILR